MKLSEHANGSTPERLRGGRLTRRELVRAGIATGGGLAGAVASSKVPDQG